MNVNHAKTETIQGDRLKAIFDRQKELMEKYHSIEARSGLLQTPDCPVSLDDPKGQARIKDFAWRMTEEIGEAIESKHDEEHFTEELIDGLHFLTELTILAGKDYNTITDFEPMGVEQDYLELFCQDARDMLKDSSTNIWEDYLFAIGTLCNCLKNKPWKQSHIKTDVSYFYTKLNYLWNSYFTLLTAAGLSSFDIADLYLRKSQVNKFRQRSNY